MMGGESGRMAPCPLSVPPGVVCPEGVYPPSHRGGHAANAGVLLPGLPSSRLLRLWVKRHRLGETVKWKLTLIFAIRVDGGRCVS